MRFDARPFPHHHYDDFSLGWWIDGINDGIMNVNFSEKDRKEDFNEPVAK